MSVGTPPPPKPWETTTLSNNNGSSSTTTKDTPLASGDAIKPWDVPGAGERPSGACDDHHIHHHRSLFLFALKSASKCVSYNVFDFFQFQLRALSSLSLPRSRLDARARDFQRSVVLVVTRRVLSTTKNNTNTNSERGDGIEPIRGNESTSGSTDDWAKSGIERRGRRGRTVDVVRRRRRIRGRFWWIWNGVWWVWVWVRRYVVLRRVRVFDVRRRRRVR
mgnify:CR=1 FL=1